MSWTETLHVYTAVMTSHASGSQITNRSISLFSLEITENGVGCA